MAETTGIAWTRSTWNPWIGCTEVSPGCDACYARELDKRHRYGGATHWGVGVPRFHTSESYWRQPARWNRIAALERETGKIEDRSNWHTPGFWPVFPSMCDPFDNEVSGGWREEMLDLIERQPNLTWLLLTKRIGNVAKMMRGRPTMPNVWIGASIVNQEEADRDIRKLIEVDAERRFISYEPALSPVDWDRALSYGHIDQVIVGGESNQGKQRARRFDVERARAAKRACSRHGVAFFMKQAGAHVTWNGFSCVGDGIHPWPDGTAKEDTGHGYFRIHLKDRAGADQAELPDDLRVQEFPA